MSRRRLLPAVVMLVVFLLFGLLTTPSGNRRVTTPGAWPGTSICAEGTLADGTQTPSTPARTSLTVHIQPCVDADPAAVTRARWGIALYSDSGAYLESGSIHPFSAGVTYSLADPLCPSCV